MSNKILVAIGVGAVIVSAFLSYLFLLRGENSGSNARDIARTSTDSPPASQNVSEVSTAQGEIVYTEDGFLPESVTLVLEGPESGMVDLKIRDGLELFPRVVNGPVSETNPITLNYYDGGIVLEIPVKGVYVFENSYNAEHKFGVRVQ